MIRSGTDLSNVIESLHLFKVLKSLRKQVDEIRSQSGSIYSELYTRCHQNIFLSIISSSIST